MYQAPEVLQNTGVGTPSDVFSFGIIMWEMISGEIPYEVRWLSFLLVAVRIVLDPAHFPGNPETELTIGAIVRDFR